MDRLVYRIVRRLRAPGAPLSRNRHFDAFAGPEGRRALRIHRRVRSLEEDLARHGASATIRLSAAGDDRVRVEIGLPSLHGHRTAYLSHGELGLLLDSEAVGHLLRAAEWHGLTGPR
jgi:hypothetical protein